MEPIDFEAPAPEADEDDDSWRDKLNGHGSGVHTASCPTDWRAQLLTKLVKNPATGQFREQVMSCLTNATLILTHHEQWRGLIAHDALAESPVKTKAPRWLSHETAIRTEAESAEWTDIDTARLVSWLAAEEHIHVAPGVAEAAVAIAADTIRKHPVREYLLGLKWDGTRRLPAMLADYFGAERTTYTEAVGTQWMIGAVARIMRPGCQMDTVLILESTTQGRKKSTGLEALASTAWFSDTPFSMGDKDSYQAMRGVWIVELGELSSMKRSDLERCKNFISARTDKFRPPYARRDRRFPRQSVFAGSTNESRYFNDMTGNRRFTPVRIHGRADTQAITRDRDQLWAEARTRFECGEKWWADTEDLEALFASAAAERVTLDPWRDIVANWLVRPTTESGTPTSFEGGFTTAELLSNAVARKAADITKADEMRLAALLREFGYGKSTHPWTRANGSRVRTWAPVDQP